MGLIQREIDRIRADLVSGADRAGELYAAQQALEWALEPGGIKSPYEMITGIQEGSGDCLVHLHPLPFLDTCSHEH
jgi:hypothetical protein